VSLFPAVFFSCGRKKDKPFEEESKEPFVSTQTAEASTAPDTVTEEIIMENVFYVDPAAENAGTGTDEEPFKSLSDALAACAADSTVVLMSDVVLSEDMRGPEHNGKVTVTSEYNGKSYGGSIVTDAGYRYFLTGDTVFSHITFKVKEKMVIVAGFNSVTFDRGVRMTGKTDNIILVGGVISGKDADKDVNIIVRSGTFSEITGGSRYGTSKVYKGKINITFGGNAKVNKMFIGPWGEGGYRFADAEILIYGGQIETFLLGMQNKNIYSTGNINFYITDDFKPSLSFSGDRGSSFAISGTCPNPWGTSEDLLKKCGNIYLYCEEDNFGTLVLNNFGTILSKLLCDCASFDGIRRVRGKLCDLKDPTVDSAADIFAKLGVDAASADKNGNGSIALDDVVCYINEESGLSGGDVYRPVYHYSPSINMLSDPNGLVYNAATGEYHLYHQYANSILRDKCRPNWKHAVSTDLVNWTEYGIALNAGYTESGCAVVDVNNTSGLFDESTPPEARLVAMCSRSVSGNESQFLAYSKDGGYSYINYGVVIEKSQYTTATSKAFRDPKIVWVEDASAKNGGVWLMVVGGGRVQLFTSDDLIHWKANSPAEEKNGGAIYSECPDLFPLPLNGDENDQKWILSCAGVHYYVGSLIKNEKGVYVFKAEQNKLMCNGTSSVKGVYATQSFYNDKENRRVWINWMPDKSAVLLKYDKEWNGMMSLPYELSLVGSAGNMQLLQTPVKEVYTLFGAPVFTAENAVLSELALPDMPGNAYYLEAVLDVSEASKAGFELRCGKGETTKLTYTVSSATLALDTSKSGALASSDYVFTGKTYSAKLKPDENGKITLKIFVDTISVEVFGGNGEAVISATVFPDKDSNAIKVFGDAKVLSLKIQPAAE